MMLFEKELANYHSHLPELLANEGMFVLIQGDVIVPEAFESYEHALTAGYERFGLQPFFIRKIQRHEPVHYFNRDLKPCRS
jgi:hypothetical protein